MASLESPHDVLPQGLAHVPKLPFHRAIPVILDCVIRTSFQDLGNLGPLVLELSMHHEQYPLLLFAPPALLDLGIKMIVPALPTLLADSHG